MLVPGRIRKSYLSQSHMLKLQTFQPHRAILFNVQISRMPHEWVDHMTGDSERWWGSRSLGCGLEMAGGSGSVVPPEFYVCEGLDIWTVNKTSRCG